ncbi:MAG: indole-3-glycerol phosphate synthase TrpC [Candidatus Omnitrophica bacterium]|nr:indole-3-glycerol phosphate synthase TrpC [Candidatus Omnitrophota bacterium]
MNFLQKILKEKKDLIEKRKKDHVEEELTDKIDLLIRKSRFKSILEEPGTHLIAEIKRASPSQGDLRPDLNIVDIASIYQREGIELISILTEEKFFKGKLDDLIKVKENTNLSILCKDFIIDSYQIREAKIHGADAILLIAKILSKDQLEEFLNVTKSFKMDAVVEVHNEVELEKVLKLGKDIELIGINHRNLDDFSIDLNITGKLLPKIPKQKIVIAESGIGSALEIRQFKKIGVNGILVGESLMREEDIVKRIKEFMSALK